MDWLKIHWDLVAYQRDGAMRVIDIAGPEGLDWTGILEWDRRMIVETP